jgi:hypothetical protein
MEKLSINSEKYRRGLEYEVLDECITIEMAHRNALRYEAGKDTEQGRLHFEAMLALNELSDSLDPRDESSVRNGWIALKAMQAERKEMGVEQSGGITEHVAAAS